jgi:hypothetical protein
MRLTHGSFLFGIFALLGGNHDPPVVLLVLRLFLVLSCLVLSYLVLGWLMLDWLVLEWFLVDGL